MDKELFYIGGYSGNSPDSIYLCQYESGGITILESYGIEDASYLCLSPDGRRLYAVIEKETYKGHDGGGVAAFDVRDGGRLCFINEGFTEGAAPCYLSVAPNGKTLYVANYTGGSTAFFEIGNDGGIGKMEKLIPHINFGPPSHGAAGRQDSAHAHYIAPVLADGVQTIWICDLGLDCVIVLNSEGAELARFQTPPGCGPRHLAFHPLLPRAYAVCEMSADVFAIDYKFSGNDLRLTASRGISALTAPDPQSTSAAVRVSPGARHLLVSNRGEGTDSISVMGLDFEGSVTELEHIVSSGGSCPRDIQFNKAGDKLFAANQDSDSVNVFDWDEETGALVLTDARLSVHKPACILFSF